MGLQPPPSNTISRERARHRQRDELCGTQATQGRPSAPFTPLSQNRAPSRGQSSVSSLQCGGAGCPPAQPLTSLKPEIKLIPYPSPSGPSHSYRWTQEDCCQQARGRASLALSTRFQTCVLRHTAVLNKLFPTP